MKQLKKIVTMIIAVALVTGMFTCLVGSGEVQAASKALITARHKAENSLIKTFDTLDNTKPYTEANYKKLISIKEEGIKKINTAKSKKSVSKALKKYVSNLKAVKYMQPTDSNQICMGENGVVAWKAVKGAVKYNLNKDGLMDYADDFDYEIEIVSITGTGSDAKAKIRITRQ